MIVSRKWRIPRLVLCSAFLVFCMLKITTLPALAESEEKVVLRVPFPEVTGFTMTDENGNRYGLVVDYLNEIAKYTGWTYEFIETSREDMVKDFIAQKYDLMGGTYYSESVEQYFGYPEYSCGKTKSVLMAHWDNDSVNNHNIRTLDGKTIGVVQRATENIRRLKEFLSQNNLKCTIKEYSTEEIEADQINIDLNSGKIDLKLGNAVDDTGEFHTVAYFDAQPHYLVTQPDNQKLLEQINWAMDKILSANPNFPEELYNLYFHDASVHSLVLTQEEKDYIKKKGTVKVAVPYHFHPFYCIDSMDGNHNGVIPDLLGRITELYGVSFTYVFADSYVETQRMVMRGDADMAGFLYGDIADTIKGRLVQTDTYAALNDLFVRNKSVTYPSEGLTCGLLEGRQLPTYVQASHVISYATVDEMLNAVNNGEVDFACGLSARLEQVLQNNVFNNVVPITLSENRINISFAMPMPAEPNLLTIINKGINSMTEVDKLAILDHNLTSSGNRSTSLKKFIETNPVLAVSVIASFLILITTAIIIIAYMQVKAANMQKMVARADAESKAKSEFLSRMSHEIRTPMNAIVGTTALITMKNDIPESIKSNLAKLNASSQYLLALINDILDMSRMDNGMLEISEENFSLKQMIDELFSMMQGQAECQQIQFSCEKEVQHSDLIGDSIRLKQVLMNLLSNAVKFTKAGGQVKLSVKETDADDAGATFLFRVSDTGIGIGENDLIRIFESFEQIGTNHMRSQGTGLGLPISRNIVELMGGTLEVQSELGKGSEFYFSITLPFGEKTEAPTLQNASDLFVNARFLLAEDNLINAEIATDILEEQGASVEVATDGLKAVEKFKRSEPGYFDLILMDIQMPNMGGLEAAKVIRAADHPDAATIPIIALTANSFQEDKDMAKEAGMNDFLSKPLDLNHIYKILKEWTTNKS